MAKKNGYENDDRYQRAVALKQCIQKLNQEIHVLDEMLAEIQIERVKAEVERGYKTTPFWQKLFEMKKDPKTKEYFAEPSDWYKDKGITLCEPEIIFLRSFKAKRVEELMKEVAELSAEISED